MVNTVNGRRVRFALVGCGRISRNHIEALQKHHETAELVAVCDTDPVALAAAQESTGAQGFGSLEELLRGSDADAIILATPSGVHADQAVRVAQAGRHVITE